MKMNRRKRRGKRSLPQPSLRFSPDAWAKLLYVRDRGDTEIGGFGLSDVDDPLRIIDVLMVKQRTTAVTVAFDDEAVANLYDDLVDAGVNPSRFSRVWLHSHPGNCPLPSSTDEETFCRAFGRTDWAVMAIIARNDATYARLSFHVGPGGALEIPVHVDYERPFEGADWEAWEREYVGHVVVATNPISKSQELREDPFLTQPAYNLWDWEHDYGAAGTGSV